MRYDHVIGDWNGTHFDDEVDVVEVALQHQELFGFPVCGYYERVGFDLERESFEDLSASEQAMLNEVTAYFRIDEPMIALVGIDDHHAVSKLDHGLEHIETLEAPRERVLLVGDTVRGGRRDRRRLRTDRRWPRARCSTAGDWSSDLLFAHRAACGPRLTPRSGRLAVRGWIQRPHGER